MVYFRMGFRSRSKSRSRGGKAPAGRRGAGRQSGTASKARMNAKFVRRIVKGTMARQAEKKLAQPYEVTNNTIVPYDGTAGTPATVWPLHTVFSMPQGTGQGDRVGNKVTVHACNLRGTVRFKNINTSPSPGQKGLPMILRMLIVRLKYAATAPSYGDQSSLFQYGSISQPPSGLLYDTTSYLNKDLFDILYSKKFKVGGQNTTSENGTHIIGNNDFPYVHFFNINLAKMVPKVLTWNDSAVTPIQLKSRLYLMFVGGYATGIVPWDTTSLTTYGTGGLDFSVNCQYIDD